MGYVNKVFLMGNMTRDPELRYTPGGTPLCEFGLATNRQYKTKEGENKEETCFVDVTFWGRRGEVISQYFKKGEQIFVEGRLKLDQWETSEGRRSKLNVVGEDFQFLGRSGGGSDYNRGADNRSQQSRPPSDNSSPAASQPPEDIGEDVSDDEIPF